MFFLSSNVIALNFRVSLFSKLISVRALSRYPAGMSQDSPLPVPILSHLRGLVMRLVIYCVVYLFVSVATIGPMFWYWFADVHVHGSGWIGKFYAPLVWFCDHIESLRYVVNVYVNWWIL